MTQGNLNDYRQRIYTRYASRSTGTLQNFDINSAEKWAKAYHYYLRGWLPKFKDAMILDIGCGTGRLLHYFKMKGYKNITGVDVSAEQVKLAKQVTPMVYKENILDFLEASSQKYDLIVGLDIIEHLTKEEVLIFLDNCYSSLNLGGRLILQTPNADSPFVETVRYGDFTHEVCFNLNSLSWLTGLVGFKECQAREVGPVPYGYSLFSLCRYVLWMIVRVSLSVCNLAEMGRVGSSIYTRVFILSATKVKDLDYDKKQ